MTRFFQLYRFGRGRKSLLLPRPELLSQRSVVALAMSLLLLAGCGGARSGKPETAAAEQPGETAADSGSGVDSRPRKGEKSRKKGPTGDHIGEIRKDAWPEIWFKDPLAIAAESGTVAGAAKATDLSAETKPTSSQSPAESVKPAAGKDAEAKGGATQWAAIISGEALANETKSIKNSLTPNLQDVGRYNSKWKEVRVDASTLAVVAGVARDVPDAPSWKQNAKYIRDVSSHIAGESKANGEQYYRKAREAYDKLDALLSGSKPPGLEESAENIKFSEVANRPFLMKRMERGYNWMKADINSEALFKKNSGRVAHEGAILSLLGKVIATPDYGDHDDPGYIESADAVSQSGRDIDEAVKKEDFKAYTEALDRSYKACSKCHEVFKNG